MYKSTALKCNKCSHLKNNVCDISQENKKDNDVCNITQYPSSEELHKPYEEEE